MKTVVFTTVYPESEKFFLQLIRSINNQSDVNFTLFVCFNGCKKIAPLIKQIKVKYLYLKVNDTWQNARIRSLKKIVRENFDLLIFLDSDDFMDTQRVKFIKKKIKKYDFLVHNLKLFNKKKSNYKNFLKIKNKSYVSINQLHDKNFFGCSNTAIKIKALKTIIPKIGKNLIAFDWCIAKLLLINYFKGIYFSKPLTFYRQYSNNVTNLSNYNLLTIEKEIKAKKEHYKYFEKFFSSYKTKYQKLQTLENRIQDRKFFSSYLKKIKKRSRNYWWILV